MSCNARSTSRQSNAAIEAPLLTAYNAPFGKRVVLAGCREGLQAGRSAQAVGAATTAAVVKALVWIVAAACGTTVLFTNLGY